MTAQVYGNANGARTKSECGTDRLENAHLVELPMERNGWILMGQWPDGRYLASIGLDVLKSGAAIPLDVVDPRYNNTLIDRSGSGGLHLLYFVTGGTLTNAAKTQSLHPLIGEVDIRGNGGKLYAPGSRFDKQPFSYEILHDAPIRTLTIEQFHETCRYYTTGKSKLKTQVNGVKMTEFLAGRVDVHAERSGMIDAANEWLVWAAAMKELKALGFSRAEFTSIISRYPGYKSDESEKQLNAYWDQPDKIRARLTPGPKTAEKSDDTKPRVRDVVTKAVDNPEYAHVVHPDGAGFWCRHVSGGLYTRRYAKTDLEQSTMEDLKGINKFSVRNLNEAMGELQHELSVKSDEFTMSSDLIVFSNGVYVVPEAAFYEDGIPAKYADVKTFIQVPHRYVPAAPRPPAACEIEWHIAYQLGGWDKLADMMEWWGYNLVPSLEYKKLALVIGASDSGKSLFLRFMRNVLGAENVANETLQRVCDVSSEANAMLMDKLANFDYEVGKGYVKNSAQLKSISADTLMLVRALYSQQFEYRNTARHTFAANTLPAGLTSDPIIAGRCLIYMFQHGIPEDEKDYEFEARINQEPVYEYWLATMIEGLQRLRARRHFNRASDTEVRDIIRENSDMVHRFVKARCIENADDYEATPQADVYEAFMQWCDYNQLEYTVEDLKGFTSRMARNRHLVKEITPLDGGKKYKVYRGIQCLDVPDEVEEAPFQPVQTTFDVDALQLGGRCRP